MLGLWLQDQQLRLRDDLPEPQPAAGEALVRLLRAGICNTDLELVRGYGEFTGIPGHELVGQVVQGPPELVGKRVVSKINLACRDCRSCRRGLPEHCEQRSVVGIRGRDGAFAELICLPVANLHVVPEQICTDAATFVEPLAAALQVRQQVAVSPDDRVLVLGDGKLGQLVAQTLALTGCRLTVLGRHQRKLDLLAQRGIATARELDPSSAQSYDLAVDCTGNPSGFAAAVLAVRPRGTLVLKSTYSNQLTCDMSAVVVNEITIVGSRCGPFAPALQMLAAAQVEVAPLVDRKFPLHQAEQAFAAARAAGALKVLVDMSAPVSGKPLPRDPNTGPSCCRS